MRLLVICTALAAVTAQLAGPAAAQSAIKILQPSEDSCAAFVAAMDAHNRPELLALGGWVLGFLSGVAEGRGQDILHDTTSEGVLDRVYSDCQAEPNRPLSELVERLSRTLAAAPH